MDQTPETAPDAAASGGDPEQAGTMPAASSTPPPGTPGATGTKRAAGPPPDDARPNQWRLVRQGVWDMVAPSCTRPAEQPAEGTLTAKRVRHEEGTLAATVEIFEREGFELAKAEDDIRCKHAEELWEGVEQSVAFPEEFDPLRGGPGA